MSPTPPILVYLYPFSPYGRKITDYLTLRHIPHTIVTQSPVPPRPDLLTLGINFRMIPVVVIGRDVYCDTKLILQKLDALYPASGEHPSLHGSENGKQDATSNLLQFWTSANFQRLLLAMPPDFPALQDEGFVKDRAELWGGEWKNRKSESGKGLQAEGQVVLREMLEMLEGLIGERKEFLGGERPGLQDLNALWIYNWFRQLLKGVVPEAFEKEFATVTAWSDRYIKALEESQADKKEIEGKEAQQIIEKSDPVEMDAGVDSQNLLVSALSLKAGDKIDVWPLDITEEAAKQNKETGSLVTLNKEEVVMEVKGEAGIKLRVHAPRWGYRIAKVA